MKGVEFKILNHQAKGYSKFSDGKENENNFNPDYVLSKDFVQSSSLAGTKIITHQLFHHCFTWS